MKVAVCISGLPCLIQNKIDNIHKNVFKDYDIFYHTWGDKKDFDNYFYTNFSEIETKVAKSNKKYLGEKYNKDILGLYGFINHYSLVKKLDKEYQAIVKVKSDLLIKDITNIKEYVEMFLDTGKIINLCSDEELKKEDLVKKKSVTAGFSIHSRDILDPFKELRLSNLREKTKEKSVTPIWIAQLLRSNKGVIHIDHKGNIDNLNGLSRDHAKCYRYNTSKEYIENDLYTKFMQGLL